MPDRLLAPRPRRWPLLLVAALLLFAGLWAALWHYAAGVAESTIAGWKEREAQAGRIYSCANQSIEGFPFGIEVRCADAGAELKSARPPLGLKASGLVVFARVWQPTVLTSEVIGPLAVAEPGVGPVLSATWRHAQTQVRGLPTAPEQVTIAIEAPAVERAPGGDRLFGAARLDLDGRLVAGSVHDNPVIEIVLKLAAAAAPRWHQAAAAPTDADVTAVLRGLRDFSPKPWPARFRELQAAGGRIEIKHARLRQGETIATAEGVLGLSPAGRLDGELRLTVANLDKMLPALGLDRLLAQQNGRQRRLDNTFSALDRIMPGLGDVARQNAGPMIVAGIHLMGEPTELEGQRAVALPLRFSDGAVTLGTLLLGHTPPLY
jgi:hypothetical protein